MTTVATPFEIPRRRALFGLLLMAGMGAATYPAAVLSVLASFLIDDFGITRAEVGLIATVNVAVSAVLSPAVGRITDRVGGKRALLFIFILGGTGFLALAVSPVYGVLLAAAIPAGFSQATGNPATNKLISQHIPTGNQGIMTGIKQSGVQAAIFLGGVMVPLGATTIGWRWTLVVLAVLTLSFVPVAIRTIPADRAEPGVSAHGNNGPLAPAIRAMAVYGFLLGFGGSVTFLLPLFVEEALGGTPTLGGLAVGLVGLSAFFGRIGWARYAERRRRFVWPLGAIAIGAIGSSVIFLAAQSVGLWAMWIAAALAGLTVTSWNAVGMLGVITVVGTGQAGRASGIVLLGFLAGLGVGPPMMGWIVDTTGEYTWIWLISMAAYALAMLPLRAWARREAGARPDG